MAPPWRPPDGGYGWVVMVAAMLLMALVSCSFTTFGLYFLAFISTFDTSKSIITWILAVKLSTLGFVGIVVGPLVKIYGSRANIVVGSLLIFVGYSLSAWVSTNVPLLYLTFGFIPGLGYGCYIISTPVSIQQYFEKRRTLAFGVSAAGISLGSFVWPPVTDLLIRAYGWRGAILITGAIQLNGLVLGALMRPLPLTRSKPLQSNGQSTTTKSSSKTIETFKQLIKSLLDVSLFKNSMFMLYNVGVCLREVGHTLPFTFLPVRGVELGATHTKAALLVSTIGITSGISRVAVGFTADRIGPKRVYIGGISSAVSGSLTAASALIQSYTVLEIYAAIFGSLTGFYIVLEMVLIVDLWGRAFLPKAMGIQALFIGLSSFIGNPLIGFLLDVTGDLRYPFLVLGLIQVVGGVAVLVAVVVTRLGHTKHKTREESVLQIDV